MKVARRPPARFDVVVCGGGAAGIAAALAAGLRGCHVALVESAPRLGGTVAHALIHTLAGLHGPDGSLTCTGLARELVRRLEQSDRRTTHRRIGRLWVLMCEPDVYQSVVRDWIAAFYKIRVLTGHRVVGVRREGDAVTALDLVSAGGPRRVEAAAVVDATGGAVAELADARFVEGGSAAAAGLVVGLRGVEPGRALFPASLAIVRRIRDAVAAGELPSNCRHAWIDRGVEEDEAFVKLTAPQLLDSRLPTEHHEASRSARIAARLLAMHLRRWPGFERARLHREGTIGLRDTGGVLGDYVLTVDDIRRGARFDDGIFSCSWPIEHWSEDKGVVVEHRAPGLESYDIPRRALKVRGFCNLWVAGRALSAEPLARASARVVGACWGTGEAAGIAAAASTLPATSIPAYSNRG